MKNIELLRKEIELDVFDYNQLMSALSTYNKPRDVLTSLLRQEKIIRIRKGLYCFNKFWQKQPVSREAIANLVYGPSAISLDYALSYYGLIPEKVTTITSVTSGRSRVHETPLGQFSYTHMPQHSFSYGLTIEKSGNYQWLIALPIKALADKVWADKRFNPSSPASFESYLFYDLRIDETTLLSFLSMEKLREIKEKYSTRKVGWMADFLLNKLIGNE
ncbi:MAG: hypothetical protein IH598_08705 [Bacteroidales bacterium]|nr:hypothetical protein [Bacteroidales bacterium]